MLSATKVSELKFTSFLNPCDCWCRPCTQQVFSDLGIKYSIGGLTGSTLDSHRLIHWAGEVGGAEAQNAVVEELFNNYFAQVRRYRQWDPNAEGC